MVVKTTAPSTATATPGATTSIAGNCGGSSTDLRTYFDTLRRQGMSVNVSSSIGHNTVRAKVMTMVFREPIARVLGRYVRERHIIPLEEAIRRMTSLPDQLFKRIDRGLLRPHYAADMVVFDQKTVTARAPFDRPHAYTTGIFRVLVNGIPVVENGRHTGRRPGQLLMGPGYSRDK